VSESKSNRSQFYPGFVPCPAGLWPRRKSRFYPGSVPIGRVVAAIEDKKVSRSLFVSRSPLAPQRPVLLAALSLPSAFDLATCLDQDHRLVPLLLFPAQVSAASSICSRSYLLVPSRTNHKVAPDTGVGNAPPRWSTREVQRRRDQDFPAWPAFLCIVYLLCMYYPCCGRRSGRPGVPSFGPCAHAKVNTMSLAPTLLLSCSRLHIDLRAEVKPPQESSPCVCACASHTFEATHTLVLAILPSTVECLALGCLAAAAHFPTRPAHSDPTSTSAVGPRGGGWACVRGRQMHRCALAAGGAGRAEQRGTRQPEKDSGVGSAQRGTHGRDRVRRCRLSNEEVLKLRSSQIKLPKITSLTNSRGGCSAVGRPCNRDLRGPVPVTHGIERFAISLIAPTCRGVMGVLRRPAMMVLVSFYPLVTSWGRFFVGQWVNAPR